MTSSTSTLVKEETLVKQIYNKLQNIFQNQINIKVGILSVLFGINKTFYLHDDQEDDNEEFKTFLTENFEDKFLYIKPYFMVKEKEADCLKLLEDVKDLDDPEYDEICLLRDYFLNRPINIIDSGEEDCDNEFYLHFHKEKEYKESDDKESDDKESEDQEELNYQAVYSFAISGSGRKFYINMKIELKRILKIVNLIKDNDIKISYRMGINEDKTHTNPKIISDICKTLNWPKEIDGIF